MISSVASGPAPAISNSSRGLRLSRLISAKPPSGEIVMPATSTPCRRAASAWPSSCTTIEANSSSALATAARYAVVSELPSVVRNGPDSQKITKKKDDGPAEVDAHADAEDARQAVSIRAPEHGGMVAQRVPHPRPALDHPAT